MLWPQAGVLSLAGQQHLNGSLSTCTGEVALALSLTESCLNLTFSSGVGQGTGLRPWGT